MTRKGEAGSSIHSAHRSRNAFLLFVISFGLFHVQSKVQSEVDCAPAPYMAWTFAKSGNFDLRQCAFLEKHLGTVIVETSKGVWVSKYPPGSAISALPVIGPLALLRKELPDSGKMRALGKITATIYCSLTGALFYLTCGRLCPRAAVLASILLLFGTSIFSTASQALWMHGPATFWIMLAIWSIVETHLGNTTDQSTTPRETYWIAGFGLGMAILCRPTTILFLIATFIVPLLRRRWLSLISLATGVAAPLAILAWYNSTYFHDPVSAGYGAEASLWSTPLWLGAPGLMISPSRGLLVYTPALLLVGSLSWTARRPDCTGLDSEVKCSTVINHFLFSWSMAAVATILLYGKWHCWWGGWCFGPRFLCETMPIWCLVFGIAYCKLCSQSAKVLAKALVAASVLIQIAGVFGHHRDWNARHDLPDQGRSMWDIKDNQISANFQVLISRLRGTEKNPTKADH